jgi:hypothetical protein
VVALFTSGEETLNKEQKEYLVKLGGPTRHSPTHAV